MLEQETLAAFIGEGHLLRHIRKMRKIYDQRRKALMHALARYGSEFLHPIAAESGLHLTALVKPPFQATEISQKADQHGIRLPSLDIYPIAGSGELNGFAFGYGMIESHQMDAAIQQIVALMQNLD
jgi:GntR family transcriptional regulator/MocR family aminotransferase